MSANNRWRLLKSADVLVQLIGNFSITIANRLIRQRRGNPAHLSTNLELLLTFKNCVSRNMSIRSKIK